MHASLGPLVPEVLDCGYVLAGAEKTLTFECYNTGGEGVFRLLAEREMDLEEEEVRLSGGQRSSALRFLPPFSFPLPFATISASLQAPCKLAVSWCLLGSLPLPVEDTYSSM